MRFDVNRQAIAEVVLRDDFETKSHNCQSTGCHFDHFLAGGSKSRGLFKP